MQIIYSDGQHVRRQSSCYSEYYHSIVAAEEKDPCAPTPSDQGADQLQSHSLHALSIIIQCRGFLDKTVGRYPAQKFGFNPILLGDGVPALLKKGIVEIGD
jgi:hypothetical protein